MRTVPDIRLYCIGLQFSFLYFLTRNLDSYRYVNCCLEEYELKIIRKHFQQTLDFGGSVRVFITYVTTTDYVTNIFLSLKNMALFCWKSPTKRLRVFFVYSVPVILANYCSAEKEPKEVGCKDLVFVIPEVLCHIWSDDESFWRQRIWCFFLLCISLQAWSIKEIIQAWKCCIGLCAVVYFYRLKPISYIMQVNMDEWWITALFLFCSTREWLNSWIYQ